MSKIISSILGPSERRRASEFPAQSCNSIQITGTRFISTAAEATNGVNEAGSISIAVVALAHFRKSRLSNPCSSILSKKSIRLFRGLSFLSSSKRF